MLLTTELKLNKIKSGKRARNIDNNQEVQISCDICNHIFIKKYRVYLQHIKRWGRNLCRSCSMKLTYKEGKKESYWKIYNKQQIGKSLKERLGENKEKERLKKYKDSIKKNVHYMKTNHLSALKNKERLQNYNKSLKGKTYNEIHGDIKSKSIKNKISISSKGENNRSYNTIPSKLSGSGYQGWYKNSYFRSKLELSFIINFLEKNNIEWESGEQYKYSIMYFFNNINHTYRCDFVTNLIAYEIKPFYMINYEVNLIKFEAGKKFFSNLNKNFKILTEKDFKTFTRKDLLYLHNNGIIILNNKSLERIRRKDVL